MLQVKNLNKSFWKTEVLHDVNIEFEEGKIYGLLGRNGAGKTTLMKILSNYIVNFEGDVELNGKEVKENQKATEEILLVHKDMVPSAIADEKVKTLFQYCSQLMPKWNRKLNEKLVDEFEINIKAKYAKLSEGNKNLVTLIIGLSSGVAVKLFDEPSVGLDANNRYKFYKKLLELHEEQKDTVVISSHIIDEIENVIEDVIIIKDKTILMNEEIASVQEKAIALIGEESLLKEIQMSKNVLEVEKLGKLAKVSIYDSLSLEERKKLTDQGIELSVIPLQRLFVHLT